jgi:hypothetical protein
VERFRPVEAALSVTSHGVSQALRLAHIRRFAILADQT